MGGVTVQKDPSKWDAVIRIEGKQAEIAAKLSTIEGQELIDAREY